MQKKNNSKDSSMMEKFGQIIDNFQLPHTFTLFPNVVLNNYNIRVMGCRKVKDNQKRSKSFSPCTCHCIPDAIPMAFPAGTVPQAIHDQLDTAGLVFDTPPAVVDEAVATREAEIVKAAQSRAASAIAATAKADKAAKAAKVVQSKEAQDQAAPTDKGNDQEVHETNEYESHPLNKRSRFTMNPVFALGVIRRLLEHSGQMHDGIQVIKCDPTPLTFVLFIESTLAFTPPLQSHCSANIPLASSDDVPGFAH